MFERAISPESFSSGELLQVLFVRVFTFCYDKLRVYGRNSEVRM